MNFMSKIAVVIIILLLIPVIPITVYLNDLFMQIVQNNLIKF